MNAQKLIKSKNNHKYSFFLSPSLAMPSADERFHVVFVPYMAPGHIMPMVEIARVFSTEHNIHSTIITTPANTKYFESTIKNDTQTRITINLRTVPFPSVETGLPKNCENVSQCTTPEMTIKLFDTINLLQPTIESLIWEIKPDCIFSDVLFPWTTALAAELCVPRLAFTGSGFFNHSLSHAVKRFYSSFGGPKTAVQVPIGKDSEYEPFVVTDFPGEVVLTSSQLPDLVKSQKKTKFTDIFEKLEDAERKSFGMVANSFHELEPGYANYYKKLIGIRAWNIGPVSLYHRGATDKVVTERHGCIDWLDSKGENSVLYVCFGSSVRLSKTQIGEIVSSLDDSKSSFVWVVPKVLEKEKGEEEWWLPQGFEEKMEKCGKGMLIKGWAPQILILEHPAVGGFLTHCGWNSILEGVTAGVPMITWPLIADQFYNEKLVTQVLKFGVPVGNEDWKIWATEETPLIRRENIRMAVNKVMDGGDEADKMRDIVEKLSESAKNSVEKGGSSYDDLKILIEDIKSYRK